MLQYNYHAGVSAWVKKLNELYRDLPALHEQQFDPSGFEWIDLHDAQGSTVAYLRRGKQPGEVVVVACNFTPVVHENYRLALPSEGTWTVVANSDDTAFGGSGAASRSVYDAEEVPHHGRELSVSVMLPPLGVLVLVPQAG